MTFIRNFINKWSLSGDMIFLENPLRDHLNVFPSEVFDPTLVQNGV